MVLALGLFFFTRQAQDQGEIAVKVSEAQKITDADFAFIEDEVLRRHLVNQENVEKMRVDTTNGEDNGLIMEIDTTDPDNPKRHTRSFGLGKSESIFIGNTIYERLEDGSWKIESFTGEEVEAALGTTNKALNEEIKRKRIENTRELQFEFIEMEQCGELNCYKYKKSHEKTEEFKSSEYFWFDDKEFLLRKDLMETPEVSVLTMVSYDNIEIVPPSNE